MDISEIEEILFSIGEPKLHGEMCKSMIGAYVKVLSIFPDIEAARPKSTSGIQALCALHIALEKTKNILQHCAECSKLYLAITGDSVVLKFNKARSALEDGLKRVEDVVPVAIADQIAEVLVELGRIEFSLDPLEKQIGDEIIGLLQQGSNFNISSSNDNNELESFHQAACKLGITSSRAALRERRALKKLIDRARAEEDKRKESIVAYLLHLTRKYSKLLRSDFSDDNDSLGSSPCSPTIHGCAFDHQLSKLSSFNFKPMINLKRSEQMAFPPEELRCPISLQLMFDPVIIASGQTYERVCIEKWLGQGHNTCPKTQQQLHHLSLIPNYCVKGLVASWCEQNEIPLPDGPPDSPDLDYQRLMLSESDSACSNSVLKSVGSCKLKDEKVAPLNDGGIMEEAEGSEEEEEEAVFVSQQEDDFEKGRAYEKYEFFLKVLEEECDLTKKCKVVERIRHLLKGDEEARTYMGANGFLQALLRFLESAVTARNGTAQEIGAMALFNLAVNNNRNKEMMLASGVLPILEEMIANGDSIAATTALYLNLSCLDSAKPIIGTTDAVHFLIWVLQNETDEQCKLDAIHTLYNISSHPANIPRLLSAGIINGLHSLIGKTATEKCIAVLIYLASSKTARDEIMAGPSLITALATVLDAGKPVEQEQAAACLFTLCNSDEKCCRVVLEEGVIPSLVLLSVNGSARGRQKAQRLLMLFREQRQLSVCEQPVVERCEVEAEAMEVMDVKPLSKSVSRRIVGRAFSFWRKNKSFSVHQY